MPDEMTIGEYDLMVLKNEQEEKKRRHERSKHRWVYGSIAVGYIALACTIIGVSFIIWRAVAGPSATEQLEDQQKTECIQAGGTWIKIADGDRSDYGTCMMGRTVE